MVVCDVLVMMMVMVMMMMMMKMELEMVMVVVTIAMAVVQRFMAKMKYLRECGHLRNVQADVRGTSWGVANVTRRYGLSRGADYNRACAFKRKAVFASHKD